MYPLFAIALLAGGGVWISAAIFVAVVVLREIFIAIFSSTKDRRR